MVKIKELRTDLCLTQKDFASKLNLDAHNVGDWERGKCEPNSDTIAKISKIFNVSTDYLLGIEDDFGAKIDSGAFSDPLSKDEKKLIEEFRTLNVYSRNAILIQVEALAEKEKEKEKEKK